MYRLPDVLYAIAEAAEAVNVAGQTVEDKLIALSALREALPAGSEQGLTQASGLIGRINIAIADSFSLDLRGDGGYLAPVLHSGSAESPLLESAQQEAFERSFNSAPTSRSVYSLSSQWYVVPQAPLRRALTVVRRINSASASIRRAFLANPRPFLREELGDDAESVVLENVFRETQAYADRVLGLGLWQPRVVPWIPLSTTNWLGADSKDSKPPQKPPGLMIGDRHLPLRSTASTRVVADCRTSDRERQTERRGADAGWHYRRACDPRDAKSAHKSKFSAAITKGNERRPESRIPSSS